MGYFFCLLVSFFGNWAVICLQNGKHLYANIYSQGDGCRRMRPLEDAEVMSVKLLWKQLASFSKRPWWSQCLILSKNNESKGTVYGPENLNQTVNSLALHPWSFQLLEVYDKNQYYFILFNLYTKPL